jgi:putative IMPACT (imprinted ancient) family translation regulator
MMAFLKKYKAIVMQQNFDNECLLIISLNKKDKDSFFSAINDLYHVNLKITPIE